MVSTKRRYVSYRAALNWIADNDDCAWLEMRTVFPAETLIMLADLFDVPLGLAVTDLEKVAFHYHTDWTANEYDWINWRETTNDYGFALVPAGVTNAFSLTKIATVHWDPQKKRHVAAYNYPKGGKGNAVSRAHALLTFRGAQRWAQRNLRKFDHPPVIRNPV